MTSRLTPEGLRGGDVANLEGSRVGLAGGSAMGASASRSVQGALYGIPPPPAPPDTVLSLFGLHWLSGSLWRVDAALKFCSCYSGGENTNRWPKKWSPF